MKKTNEEKKCPRCLEVYTGYPALSRRDNRTDICSDCGTREALMDFYPLKKLLSIPKLKEALEIEKRFQNKMKKHQFKDKFNGWLKWKEEVRP